MPLVRKVFADMMIDIDNLMDDKGRFYMEDIFDDDALITEEYSPHFGLDATVNVEVLKQAFDFIDEDLCHGLNTREERFFNIGEITNFSTRFMWKYIPYDKRNKKKSTVTYKNRWGKRKIEKERLYSRYEEATTRIAATIFTRAYYFSIVNRCIYYVENLTQGKKPTSEGFYKNLTEHCIAYQDREIKADEIQPPAPYFLTEDGRAIKCRRATEEDKTKARFVVTDKYTRIGSRKFELFLAFLPFILIYALIYIFLLKVVGLDPNGIIMMIVTLIPIYIFLECINPWSKLV